MKRENMKVDMKVVVKPNAIGFAEEYIGTIQSLFVVDYCVWYIDVGCLGNGGEAIVAMPEEVRKATQHEILATMTTEGLQQLLDEIDVELDKRLAAVHPDARYMFRECVVAGYTCYVMGFGDAGSNKPSEHLLISGHPLGYHGGRGQSFSGDWAGRNDLLWQYKRDVKLVNEDGSLEDVL